MLVWLYRGIYPCVSPRRRSEICERCELRVIAHLPANLVAIQISRVASVRFQGLDPNPSFALKQTESGSDLAGVLMSVE